MYKWFEILNYILYTVNVVNSSLLRTLKSIVNISVSISVIMILNKDVFKVINIIINKLITG
ncbi:hypothetical protein JPSP44_24400 [Staphylococcus pseudintermedius]